MTAGIYQIKNTKNNKIYVGSSINIKARWAQHRSDLKKMKHHSKHLQRAWYHYGEDAFIFSILEDVEDPNLLIEREQHYLDLYKPYDKEIGYNNSPTAENCLGFRHSEESKKKMRESQRKRRERDGGWDEETKRKIGMSQKGKVIPEEVKEKMRISSRKRWAKPDACSAETRKKMSEAHKGREAWNKGIETPEEVKKKISETLKGRPSPMKNRSHTKEAKQKISEAHSGENNHNSVVTWEIVREMRARYAEGGISQRKLAEEYGVSRGCVRNIIKNRTWREQ
jgi:group I intron endonuclease